MKKNNTWKCRSYRVLQTARDANGEEWKEKCGQLVLMCLGFFSHPLDYFQYRRLISSFNGNVGFIITIFIIGVFMGRL